jgi:hypothetical protein
MRELRFKWVTIAQLFHQTPWLPLSSWLRSFRRLNMTIARRHQHEAEIIAFTLTILAAIPALY